MNAMKRIAVLPLLLFAGVPVRAQVGVPLPPAAVRIVVPDVAAFDAALTGAFRRALLGRPDENDALTIAWQRTPVGTKLEAQWRLLGADLPWNWADVQSLKPRSLGVALLSAGSLEAVLVINTPLAALPASLPVGTSKSHAGVAYALVTRGAGDGGPGDRRMGLAWARHGHHLLLATSERALLATIDEAVAGREVQAPLPGVASMVLDVDALRHDRYFRREFLFGANDESGQIETALSIESGHLVEVRRGTTHPGGGALAFDSAGAAAAAYEPDGKALWPTLRAALLEPRADLQEKPVPPLLPLPAAVAAKADDRYLINLEKPIAGPGAPWEEGDLLRWQELAGRHAPAGFGFLVRPDGTRLMVFDWPAGLMADLEKACRATLERRSGVVNAHGSTDARELRVGPELPVLAWRRVGERVWIGPSAAALTDLPAISMERDLVRWARVDLTAARAESARWARAEGPAVPEVARPFSDRILGLLGWLPATTSLKVERRAVPAGWVERVEFGSKTP